MSNKMIESEARDAYGLCEYLCAQDNLQLTRCGRNDLLMKFFSGYIVVGIMSDEYRAI